MRTAQGVVSNFLKALQDPVTQKKLTPEQVKEYVTDAMVEYNGAAYWEVPETEFTVSLGSLLALCYDYRLLIIV